MAGLGRYYDHYCNPGESTGAFFVFVLKQEVQRLGPGADVCVSFSNPRESASADAVAAAVARVATSELIVATVGSGSSSRTPVAIKTFLAEVCYDRPSLAPLSSQSATPPSLAARAQVEGSLALLRPVAPSVAGAAAAYAPAGCSTLLRADNRAKPDATSMALAASLGVAVDGPANIDTVRQQQDAFAKFERVSLRFGCAPVLFSPSVSETSFSFAARLNTSAGAHHQRRRRWRRRRLRRRRRRRRPAQLAGRVAGAVDGAQRRRRRWRRPAQPAGRVGVVAAVDGAQRRRRRRRQRRRPAQLAGRVGVVAAVDGAQRRRRRRRRRPQAACVDGGRPPHDDARAQRRRRREHGGRRRRRFAGS
jgi:hypothetical protein